MKKEKVKAIVIRKDFCKGCGICVAFCPGHVLEMGEDDKAFVKNIEACTACRLCEMRCPDLAIELHTEAGGSDTADGSEEGRMESVEQRA
ncbi:MAG: ferredoxin family protein [Deltaproteobacteria bacterium]|nr:ferredoxin family protein [Deltaproteobacteria bacterium]